MTTRTVRARVVGVVCATLAVAAVALTGTPAIATQGQPVVAGMYNDATVATTIQTTGSGNKDGLDAYALGNGIGVYGQSHGNGLQGYSDGSGASGVWGVDVTAGGTGVSGISDANGGTGLYGQALGTGGHGLYVKGAGEVTACVKAQSTAVDPCTFGGLYGTIGISAAAPGVGVYAQALDSDHHFSGDGVIAGGVAGVFGYGSSYGLVGGTTQGSSNGVGVHGYSHGGSGIGVWASSEDGQAVALRTDGVSSFNGSATFNSTAGFHQTASFSGRTTFSRSGVVTIAYPNKSATVPVTGGLTVSSMVVATAQSNVGVYVKAAVPNPSNGTVTIYVNKAPGSNSSPKSVPVAWFVLG